MTKFFKKTAKKIYKTGFFDNMQTGHNSLVFNDCFGNVYSIQKVDFRYRFRIGHAITAKVMMPSFRSEYTRLEETEVAQFIDHVTPEYTDNPDFILRASLWYIGME